MSRSHADYRIFRCNPFIIIFVAVFSLSSNAFGCGTRHFYNNSPVPFTINMENSGKCSVGNSPQQGSCEIPPMGVAELHYDGWGYYDYSISIVSNDGGRVYSQQSFAVGGPSGTCHIEHSGDTGSIAVNAPANGDVTTCGIDGYSCECLAGGTCSIDRSGWVSKQLDMTRTGDGCGADKGVSCWRVDDEERDKLDMRWGALNFVSEIKPNGLFPQQGRFIFVYRASDNKLLVRNYDRAHDEDDQTLKACLNYAQYRYPGNMRSKYLGGVDTYLHVRHSQLNGGWGPVWCAGEMRIEDGKLSALNNASGHYQPNKDCLSNVMNTLAWFGYQVADNVVVGSYLNVSVNESCPPSPQPVPVPDDSGDHDEL